ncbi:MAG: uracil-DNA glycosylase [Verrucomicrobia bacterium]|nr:uracil-DNA glycosylase [Verrucomicrobiota bacterium]
MEYTSLNELRTVIENCRLCKRLVHYRESVEPKPQYEGQTYWRRPVAGFGDPESTIFILALAPAAHGGNRTGRAFTGDKSGDFLFNSLYKAGLSNQATSVSRDDGLILKGCYITAAVKCAPPRDRPTAQECHTCSPYWENELHLLKKVKSVICLGTFAFNAFLTYARKQGISTKGLRFKHGASYHLPGLATLYASYHPSPHNTNTGRLTEEMLIRLFLQVSQAL